MAKKTNTGLVSFCKECLTAKLGYVYSAFGRVCTKSLLDQAASHYPANNLAGGQMRKVGEKWLGRRVVDCSFCKECLTAKLGYVYSAFGRVCTKSLLDQAASHYPANNLAGGQMRKVGEKWLGRRVVDCSGMIKYYLMADKFGDDPKYTAALDTAVHISKASKQGEISTLPEVPGTILWMPGHVGVYLGNGQVIESKGTAYGVVQTALKGRGWQKWFWIKEIDYSGKPEKIPLSLDTQEYVFDKQGETYQFLARGSEKPEVSSSRPDVIRVEFAGQDSRGYLYRLRAIKPGLAAITVKTKDKTAGPEVSSSRPDVIRVEFAGQDSRGYLYRLRAIKPGLAAITVKTKDKTAGFRASLGCKLDTHTYRCKAGQAYQFLSHSVKKPDIDPGDVNVVEVTYSGQDKRGNLFTLQAKKPGTAVITASLGGMKDTLEVEVEA